MATESLTNGVHDSSPVELSLSLPHTPGVEINLHLTIMGKTILLFVTSTSLETGRRGPPPMGSFVYSIPDRYNANEPLTTALYHSTASIDFATHLARLLARKTSLPCYVGNSINLSHGPSGGSMEEEMEAFKITVDAVLQQIAADKTG